MCIDILIALKNSFTSLKNFKTWLPFLLLYMIVIHPTLHLAGIIDAKALTKSFLRSIYVPVMVYVILLTSTFFLSPLAIVMCIDQSINQRPLSKSLDLALKKYVRVLLFNGISLVISLLISSIGLGILLLPLAFLAFFYVYPMIVLGRRDLVSTVEKNFKLVEKFFKKTFISSLVITLTNFLLFLIGLMLIGLYVFFFVTPDTYAIFETPHLQVISVSLSSLMALLTSLILSFQTRIYLRLRSRRR